MTNNPNQPPETIWADIEGKSRYQIICFEPSDSLTDFDKSQLVCYTPYDPTITAKLETSDAMAALLEEYRTKTPLGHQPHMIAHRADETLSAYRKASQ